MKIGIISTMNGSPWGGSEFLWAVTAEQAILEGHKVLISLYDWSISHPLVTHLQQQGALIFPRTRFPKPPSLTLRILKKFQQTTRRHATYSKPSYQLIFNSKPDFICISQGGSYDTVYTPELINLLSSYSIPYLVICQFNSDSCFLDSNARKVAKEFFDRAAYVTFVSRQNLELAERQLAQSLPNAVVVQNPVNMHDLSIVPFPSQSKAYFACVARLETACKGQDVLFEALSLPQWRERDWQCCLYGYGPDQAYLEALAAHYCIAQKVKFMGHVKDVRSIWAENHILVLPSRAEGTPLSLVEAMICGRPAVITDVGGNADWIEESQTGFVAQAATAKSFGTTLERAWLVRDNWKQMGAKAHEFVSAKFDRSPGQSLLKLILEAANNKQYATYY